MAIAEGARKAEGHTSWLRGVTGFLDLEMWPCPGFVGVYQDGRMSPRGWDVLAPYLVRALGPARCDIGYDSLTSSNSVLADAVDGYTKEDGPTDDLLAQLAPAAQGDLVLVLILETLTGNGGASSLPIWPPTTRVCIGSTRVCRDRNAAIPRDRLQSYAHQRPARAPTRRGPSRRDEVRHFGRTQCPYRRSLAAESHNHACAR
jgi:hypothetical protein